MSQNRSLFYSSRKGGFYDNNTGELIYPLIAGYELHDKDFDLMNLVVRALEGDEYASLQRIYTHLLENYIGKELLK